MVASLRNSICIRNHTVLIVLAILGLYFLFTVLSATVYAQTSPIASVLINNGDETTTSRIVTVQLRCESTSIYGCYDIEVIWENADANVDSSVVDEITVTISSASGGSDKFVARETGQNTGVFDLLISNAKVPVIYSVTTPEAIGWGNGDTVTIQDLPFSSVDGVKVVNASFSFDLGRVSASDDILLATGGHGSCSGTGTSTSTDTVDLTISDSNLRLTRGIPASTTLTLLAPGSNFDRVATLIFVQDPSNGPRSSLSQNDFFINPGETKNIDLSFDLSNNSFLGNYTYHTTIIGKDVYGCKIKESSADIELSILQEPDFFISSFPSEVTILRGNTSSVQTTVGTLANTFGPVHIEFQAGWDPKEVDHVPVNTETTFDSGVIDLEPGESVTKEITFSPAISGDPSLVNYAGQFMYTIQANGTWIDAAGTSHHVIKELSLPVSITEQEFDFSVSADQQTLFLEKDKTSTVELSVKHLSGRNYPVTLTPVVSALGLDTNLDQTTGVPDYSTNLNIKAQTTIAPRELEVVAKGGGKTHSVKIMLSSTPFAMIVEPESTVSPGQASEVTISLTPIIRNYTSTVHLELSSQDISRSSLTWDTDHGVPPFSTKLVITTDSTAPVNNYPIYIVASDGVFSTRAVHMLHVVLPSIHIDMEPRLDSLSIDGSLLPSSDLNFSPNWKVGEQHELTALSEIQIDGSTRYVFDGWSDGVKSPERVVNISTEGLTIVGKYKPQYLLTLESEYGNTIGAGWYDASSMADFGIDSDAVLTSSGAKTVFNGWTGPSVDAINVACDGQKIKDTPDSKSFQICMDKPQTLVALWKQDTGSAGIIGAAIAGVAVVAFGAMAHFVLPKPFSKPTIPVEKGHTFGLRVEVHVDEIGGIIGGTGSAGSMLSTIPSFSVDSLSQTVNNSLNLLLLQDTAETFEQFKQLKFVKKWLRKTHSTGNTPETLPVASGPEVAGLDVVSELKKIIAENLGKASTPDLVRMIRGVMLSQVQSQLEKGIETVPVPLPLIGISIEFIPLVDGVPVKNSILRVPFQIAPALELKDVKSILGGDTKSFFADFVDLRLKLYYMMPMMIGLKKVRIAENLNHIAKDVSFQHNAG